LPSWPKHRLLELAPVYWQSTTRANGASGARLASSVHPERGQRGPRHRAASK
jgi:hypothetical protein